MQVFKQANSRKSLIAHRLYFLDDRDDKFSYWKQRRQEKEAEVFAAYLLIPEEKLNEKLKEEWVKESPNPIPELELVCVTIKDKLPEFKNQILKILKELEG